MSSPSQSQKDNPKSSDPPAETTNNTGKAQPFETAEIQKNAQKDSQKDTKAPNKDGVGSMTDEEYKEFAQQSVKDHYLRYREKQTTPEDLLQKPPASIKMSDTTSTASSTPKQTKPENETEKDTASNVDTEHGSQPSSRQLVLNAIHNSGGMWYPTTTARRDTDSAPISDLRMAANDEFVDTCVLMDCACKNPYN
ncbi:hypothetical protein CC80DRAFT_589193 [Byssothecium circinans]|uniref:Uncharacterized protein n=1 Tax=Byssothecium circinans TaxID=147558 RepID=A0A6A5UD67_9PLEO|nr:hypothetical protein CC80DRAFT_589193 [Byssothecium circinans]